MKKLTLLAIAGLAGVFLSACREQAFADAEILAIGDSVIWWNIEDGASIADVIAETLDVQVVNAAVPGAEIIAPRDSIPDQYQPGPWRWVVMDGGANDLGDFCGQLQSSEKMDQLIGADLQSGAMPEFMNMVRADGPQIVIMGYYMPPVTGGEFAACGPDFSVFNSRLAGFAAQTDGVFYAPAGDVIVPSDLSHYDPDLVHPSAIGSRLIALQMADIIAQADSR